MERDPVTGEPVGYLRPEAERAAVRRRRRLTLTATLLVVGAVVAIVAWRDGARTPTGTTRAPQVSAPAGTRIRVEVLNATNTPRLARQATRVLRARGFDVVEIGNASEKLDTTLVLDRIGHPEWASLVAAAMNDGARVEARPDSSRYLDVTVLVGASWRPPPEALYP